MGKTASRMSRPLKNWNVEDRAHKIISKDKPTPAPTYASTKKQIELVNKLEPDYKVVAARKDPQLDDFLKQVYVKSDSTNVQQIDSRDDPNRPLPKDRLLHEGFELGFHVPEETKAGKLNLKQALELLSNHQNDPKKYSVENISAQYQMDPKLVANILEYYHIFQITEKQSGGDKETTATIMPISQKSGATIKMTVKKKLPKPKKDIDEDDDDDGDESSHKKLSDRKKVDRIEGK